MNLLQLKEGLENNTISVDYKGHMIGDIILSAVKYKVDRYTKKDDYWIDHNFEIGDYFVGLSDIYCFDCEDCGKRLYISPTSENSVSLIDIDYINSECERQGFKKYYPVKVDVNLIPECSIKPLRESGKLLSEINVPSGELLFTNFFKEKNIYTMPGEYSTENSIQSIRGRNNLMQYLSAQNIGYGQMSNMSVNVFVNNTGDEIIIGVECGYNEEYGEFDISHEGFTNYGSISLDVWRWMCGDIQILKEHGEKIPNDIIPNNKVKNKYVKYILTTVKPGIWVIEHFFDFVVDDNEPEIYSKLYLKK